mmetsp:Transcript_8514/g.17260  ORF Transcript_8514/g.17260 Transcript_8514/m.17260 type:complete len:99 (+) Transcript_8514:248-544(+)
MSAAAATGEFVAERQCRAGCEARSGPKCILSGCAWPIATNIFGVLGLVTHTLQLEGAGSVNMKRASKNLSLIASGNSANHARCVVCRVSLRVEPSCVL